MAVAAVRTEREDNRPELADDLGYLVHQGREPGVGQGAVDVVQAAHRRDAEALAGQAQLGLPDSRDRPPGTGGSVADLARLAPGRRYHHDLGTLFGVAGERAPGAERLVVRMGEHTKQAAAASLRHAVIEQARPRGARLARARPARRALPDQALSPGQVRYGSLPRPEPGPPRPGPWAGHWSPQRPAAARPLAKPVAAAEPGTCPLAEPGSPINRSSAPMRAVG